MGGGHTRSRLTGGTARRFVVVSAIAVVATVAFLPSSGFGSGAPAREAAGIPAGLAAAIHARLGAGAIRASSASSATFDPFVGASVALSADGTTALVGAPGAAGFKGAAYIFRTSGAGSWSSSETPTAVLTDKSSRTELYGIKGGEKFGETVALSADGTTAVVGAPFHGKGGNLPWAGAIYVFHVSAEDAWSSSSSPTATLKVNSTAFTWGLLGEALALSADGTTLLVGAPWYYTEKGGAFVFHVSSEGAWKSTSTPTAVLRNASEGDKDGHVGEAVAISADGTTALVSDSFGTEGAGSTGGGGAYIYHVPTESSWASSSAPNAILSDTSSGLYNNLGTSVALSPDGTLALLGAFYGQSGRFVGYVDVFHSSGEAAWATTSTPTATLTKAGTLSADEFGESLALSSDGTTALVTADGVNASRGAAYIFRASSEGAWVTTFTPTASLTDSGGKPQDLLGRGVLSPDGATLLVGTPGANLNTGAAEVFHVVNENAWDNSATPTAILTNKVLAACVVPKLKGRKLPDAKDALAVGRCRVGKVTKVHVKTKKRRGHVLSQNKKPGSRLAIHAKVSFKVGK